IQGPEAIRSGVVLSKLTSGTKADCWRMPSIRRDMFVASRRQAIWWYKPSFMDDVLSRLKVGSEPVHISTFTRPSVRRNMFQNCPTAQVARLLRIVSRRVEVVCSQNSMVKSDVWKLPA